MYLCLHGYYWVFICWADAAPAWAGTGVCGSRSTRRACGYYGGRCCISPLAPIPAPQRKPWFSLNLVDYTTLTIRLYYACRVPFYRWRLIVYSYFNLINNITISPSGVATNFFMDVNESEIWHAVSNDWTVFQHGVISSICNSCEVSDVYRALEMIHICLHTNSHLLICSSVDSFLQSKKPKTASLHPLQNT